MPHSYEVGVKKVLLVGAESVKSFAKDVTTAGTAVTLHADYACNAVIVKAKFANTGVIYVGGSDVTSANGFALRANEAVRVPTTNANLVYINSSVNGEGVTFLAG